MTKARDIASAIPAPSTVSSAELGYLDGVTSAIQTQVDAKIAKTLTTTTGDIIYASGANTPARLGIGSSAQVLTVASGVPSWATAAGVKSYSLLNTTSLTAASTITVSSLGGYDDLLFMVSLWTCGTASSGLTIRFNADSGSNYTSTGMATASAATYDRQMIATGNQIAQTAIQVGTLGTIVGAGLDGTASLRISGANSTGVKAYTYMSGTMQSYTSSTMTRTNQGQGIWNNSAKLTSMSVISSAGNFTAGTLYIYGAI